MNIENEITKAVKENAGSMMHPKGHVLYILDSQDLKDLTKSLADKFSFVGDIEERKELLHVYIEGYLKATENMVAAIKKVQEKPSKF